MRALIIVLFTTSCATTELRSIERMEPAAELARRDVPTCPSCAKDEVRTPAPDPARTRKVNLAQLLAYAEQHAPSLVLARSQRALAQARVNGAGRLLPANPRLETAFGPRVASAGSAFDFEVSLSQEFEIAGQRGLRRQAAKRYAELVEQRIAQARWQARLQIAMAYGNTVVTRERQRIASEQVAFSKELVRAAKRRLKAGDISPLQLKLAEMEVEQAGQSEISVRGAYARARIQLAAVSGWPTATPPEPRGHCRHLQTLPPWKALLERSRTEDPTLAARRKAVDEARARVATEGRVGWPNPAIGLSYAREGDPGGVEGAVHVGSLTLGIDLPLWRRNFKGRATAQADLAVAKVQLEVYSRRMEGRLRAALSAVKVAARRVAHFGDRILPRYRESLHLLRRSFELGEVDLLQVFVARGRLITGQLNFIEAKASHCRALLELESLVGSVVKTKE